MNTITVTVDDGTDPITGVYVDILADGSDTLITSGTTDGDGEVVFALPTAAYDVRLFKPGYSFTVPEDMSVTATAGFTFSGTALLVTPPATPTLCRLYLDVVNFNGTPRSGARVTVENLFTNPAASPVMIEDREEYSADASGRIVFDLVRGSRVRVSLGYTPFQKEILVPNLATQDLAALLGNPVDSFTVIPSA